MPFDPCTPCENCIPANISNDLFKQSIWKILCEILGATVDPVAGLASFNPMIEIEFDDIEATFENTNLLGSPWKGIHLNNNTDGVLLFVFANTLSDPEIRLVANETRELDFHGAAINGGFYVKWEVQPTVGQLFIEAWS